MVGFVKKTNVDEDYFAVALEMSIFKELWASIHVGPLRIKQFKPKGTSINLILKSRRCVFRYKVVF